MMGPEVDYATRPAEDFARGALTFVDPEGHEVMVEATNSWAYVGAGLRILHRAARPGILDGVFLAQYRAEDLSVARGRAAARAKIWSRSRMPSRA